MYFIHLEKENDTDPLTLEDWILLVNNDPEMHYTNTITYESPFGEIVTKSGGFYGIWKPSTNKNEIIFTFKEGIVSVIYDALILKKLQEISNRVEGYVYGDNGEEY